MLLNSTVFLLRGANIFVDTNSYKRDRKYIRNTSQHRILKPRKNYSQNISTPLDKN